MASEAAKRSETPGFVAETETLHDWHALWYLNAHPAFAADYVARNAQDLLAHVIKSKVNIINRHERPSYENYDDSDFIMIGPMYDSNETSVESTTQNTHNFNEDPNVINSISRNSAPKRHHHTTDPLRQSRLSPMEHTKLHDNSSQAHPVASKTKSSAQMTSQSDVIKILQQKHIQPPRMLAALAIGRFAYDVVAIDDEETLKFLLPKPMPQKIDQTQRLDHANGSSFKQIKNRIASADKSSFADGRPPELPSYKLTSAPAFNKMLLLHPPTPETVFKPFECIQTSTDVEMVEENLHEVIFSICKAIGQMIESEHTSMYVAREDARGHIYLERRLDAFGGGGGMNEKIDISARNTIASYAADKRCAIAVASAHQISHIFPLGIGQRNREVAHSVISVPILVGDENRLIGVVEYYRSAQLSPFKSALLKDVVKILCASALCVLGTPAFDRDRRIDLLTGLYGPSLASTVQDFDDAVNKLLAMGKKIIDAEKSYIYFLLPRESYELETAGGRSRSYAVKTENSKTATGVVHHYFTVSHKVFNYRLRGQGMASALREYTREAIANKYFDAALQQQPHRSTCINFDADHFFHKTDNYRARSSLTPQQLESSPLPPLSNCSQFKSNRNSITPAPCSTRASERGGSTTRNSSVATRDGSLAPTWERVSQVVGRLGSSTCGDCKSSSADIASSADDVIIPNEKHVRNAIIMPIEYMDNSIGLTPCLLAIMNKKHQPNGFNRFDEHVVRKFAYYCGVILSNSTMQYTNSLNRLYLQTTLDEEAFFLTPAVAEAAEFCALVEKRIKISQNRAAKLRSAKKSGKSENPDQSAQSTGRKFQLPFAVARIFYKLFLFDENKKISPLQLARPQLFNFILAVEKNCQSQTVHHNYQHAVESCQALYGFFKQLPALWNLYTLVEQYALFLSIFCHTLDYLYDADHIERFHPRIAGLFTCPHDENDAGRELLQILSKAERNDFMHAFPPEQRALLLDTLKRYEAYTDLLHAPQVIKALEKEYIGGDLYYETGDPYIKELLTKLLILVADLQWTCSAFPQHRQKIRDYVNLWINKADHLKLYGINIFNLLGVATPENSPTSPPGIFNVKTVSIESVQSIAVDMASFLRIYVLPCYQMLARVFPEMQPWYEAVDANMCAWQLCADRPDELDWRIVTLAQLSQFDMQTELRAKRALALQTAAMRLDRTLDDDKDSGPFEIVSENIINDHLSTSDGAGVEPVTATTDPPTSSFQQMQEPAVTSAPMNE